MSTADVVDRYYDAWAHRQGDLTDVPLADDFRFTGPVTSFDSAAAFRETARRAGAVVRNYRVRSQYHDGDVVVSIVDWEMEGVPGRWRAAELLEVRDGHVVRGEVINDAEELRKVMAQARSQPK